VHRHPASSRWGFLLRAGPLFLAAAAILPGGAPAQEPPAQEPPVIEGLLLLGGEPADSGTVVLHRVSPGEAGALDSLRVRADGTFRIPLPRTPVLGSGEVFFLSHRYEGVLYFGAALAAPDQIAERYEIRAYPTREAPAEGLRFPVEVRNLFVEESPVGWRVTDLFEVRNDSAVTWIPGPDGGPVWTYPLPPGAFALRVGQEDVAADAVSLADGLLRSTATVPPGERLMVVEYDLPSLDVSIPLPGTTGAVELLVREPAPTLHVEGLRAEAPLEIEVGSVYRRWWGEEITDGVVRIRAEDESPIPVAWLSVGLALLLVLAGSWLILGRRPKGAEPAGGPPADDLEARRREILLEIARLDESRPPREEEAPEVRRKRDARRARLLERLDAIERERVGEGEGR
jgi:hypothetical protein